MAPWTADRLLTGDAPDEPIDRGIFLEEYLPDVAGGTPLTSSGRFDGAADGRP